MIKGIFWFIFMLVAAACFGGIAFSNTGRDPVIGALTLTAIILAMVLGALFVAALWRVQA